MRIRVGGVVLAACVLLLAACGDDDGAAGDDTTTTVTVAPTTTAAGDTTSTTTTSTTTTSTTTTAAEPTTTVPLPDPGDPCEPGSSDDCVDDAWGDGIARYIEGYAECIGALGDDAGECSDLDGDGLAGYPDSG